MKVELKNVKVCQFASEETPCFHAVIYIDGQRAGTVSNDGQGGSDNLHFTDPKVEQAFHDYCKSLPADEDPDLGKLEMDAELFIAGLLDEYETQKQFRRWCKTKLVFRVKSDSEGQFRTLKAPYSQRAAEHVRQKYGAALDYILNEKLAQA